MFPLRPGTLPRSVEGRVRHMEQQIVEQGGRPDAQPGGVDPVSTQHLIDDRRRDYDLEARLAQEPSDQPAWRAAWLDDGADVDVRVEDSADQWLLGPAARLPRPLASRALRLQGDFERLLLSHPALLLPLEELQSMAPCESAHLLQSLDRDQCSQWLALPLDDELIVAERDPVEQVTDPLADVDCGYFLHP